MLDALITVSLPDSLPSNGRIELKCKLDERARKHLAPMFAGKVSAIERAMTMGDRLLELEAEVEQGGTMFADRKNSVPSQLCARLGDRLAKIQTDLEHLEASTLDLAKCLRKGLSELSVLVRDLIERPALVSLEQWLNTFGVRDRIGTEELQSALPSLEVGLFSFTPEVRSRVLRAAQSIDDLITRGSFAVTIPLRASQRPS